MVNTKHSYTEYVVSTPTARFQIGFEFKEGVQVLTVTLDNVDITTIGYTFKLINNITIETTPAIPSGLVRVSRITDIDNNIHKFTAGALFTAKSMDENFEQVRHSQQEVNATFELLDRNINIIADDLEERMVATTTVANTALRDAATALRTANNAQTTANAISAEVERANKTAAAANAKADAASATAANADSKAAAALSIATGIEGKVDAANKTAGAAKDIAEGIEGKADQAIDTANGIDGKAQDALDTANGIDGKASTALSTAEAANIRAGNAETQSAQALSLAGNASSNAESAVLAVNAAVTSADQATTTANAAKATADGIDSKATQAAVDAAAAVVTANKASTDAQAATEAVANKQNKLTAGDNITIDGNVISSDGGGATLGANEFFGNQYISGDLKVTENVHMNIKPLLNATGDAPISACRAWVCFNGSTGAIDNSFNVLSVIRNGIGDYTVNFLAAMPSANYALFTSGVERSNATPLILSLRNSSSKTITSVRVSLMMPSGSLFDASGLTLGVFC